MMYYILRLADAKSFNKVFAPIEKFLDVTMTENMEQLTHVDVTVLNSFDSLDVNATSSATYS
jgi:hypothetical protein